jgi:solute carrier family 25 oxoglutarate transporter 11
MTIFLCDCSDSGKPPNFATKAALGMTAGAIGSFVGTPAEISLIRMTADGRYLHGI